MARLPRYSIKNQPQHVILRGLEGQDVFIEDEDYLFYWECLCEAAEVNKLKVHAYILMPNHIHLLASPGAERGIPKALQSVGRRYVQHFNRNYEGSGGLWDGRYRATVLDPKAYLLTCSRYIELNGVRAGFVSHPKHYDWSSYGHNASGVEDPLITEHRIYQNLATPDKSANQVYRSLFKNRITAEELEVIRNSTNKAWAMGDKKFADKIEKVSGRRATQLSRGRPRLK